jgi:hypothetical protein
LGVVWRIPVCVRSERGNIEFSLKAHYDDQVFISYRRDDSSAYAGRVHDRLEREFVLFMDVDAIPLGVNFIKVLREEAAKCDVLLAVIGSNWLNVRDEQGNPRLDNPNDFVRLEIATALHRDIPVIPILLDGAKIPKTDQLPEDLKELALRNALDVRHASFHSDMNRLIQGLKSPSGEVDRPPPLSPAQQRASKEAVESQVRVAAEVEVVQREAQVNRASRLRKAVIVFGSGIVLAGVIFGAVVVKRPSAPTPQPPAHSDSTVAARCSATARNHPTGSPNCSATARAGPTVTARRSDGAGGAARRALRRGFERSARQALRRLRYLAHRNSIARPRLAPALAVRADIAIPEQNMTSTWSLHRNTDQALPASHTVEIKFNLPANFPGGAVADVPGILMKQSEQTRGTPLAGLSVNVTNGFFLIGLSAVDSAVQRNIQLLKERPWFDIPLIYTNGGRAILAMEKGPPGDKAFADAFAAWGK